MSQPEFPTELHLRPRPTITITLNLPTDTFAMVQEVAASRDMSAEALLKLYIGQGLRHDIAQRFADRVLVLTAQVLARHGQSPEQVDAILRDIRSATGA
jgi:hypothetical protein